MVQWGPRSHNTHTHTHTHTHTKLTGPGVGQLRPTRSADMSAVLQHWFRRVWTWLSLVLHEGSTLSLTVRNLADTRVAKLLKFKRRCAFSPRRCLELKNWMDLEMVC